MERQAAQALVDAAHQVCPYLLLQRLRHLGVSCRQCLVLLLQLREQPHILDGDDGLVGEGLEQFDPGRREEARLLARHENRPDSTPFAQHWYSEPAPEAGGPCDLLRVLAGGFRVLQVPKLDDRSRQDRARSCQRTIEPRLIGNISRSAW
jgi:hypothetical protein